MTQSGGGLLLVPILMSWIMIPVGVVLVVVGLIRYFWPREDDPAAILKRRYAAGEISQSEYQTLLHDLNADGGDPS